MIPINGNEIIQVPGWGRGGRGQVAPGKIGDGVGGGGIYVTIFYRVKIGQSGRDQLRLEAVDVIVGHELGEVAGGVGGWTASSFIYAERMTRATIPNDVAPNDEVVIGVDGVGDIGETRRWG